ncbi:hypothetical protein ACFQX6_38775 [Streptosporangium lutulentum]
MPPVDLTDRIERSTRADKPIRILAKAVRRRIRPGRLRDLLHGVPLGKPLHPPLANASLGFWMATAVLDVTHSDPRAARMVLAAGIAGAMPAAAAGVTDWSVLHESSSGSGSYTRSPTWPPSGSTPARWRSGSPGANGTDGRCRSPGWPPPASGLPRRPPGLPAGRRGQPRRVGHPPGPAGLA